MRFSFFKTKTLVDVVVEPVTSPLHRLRQIHQGKSFQQSFNEIEATSPIENTMSLVNDDDEQSYVSYGMSSLTSSSDDNSPNDSDTDSLETMSLNSNTGSSASILDSAIKLRDAQEFLNKILNPNNDNNNDDDDLSLIEINYPSTSSLTF